MSSLNDAVGDGGFITPDIESLKDVYSEEDLLQMSPSQITVAEQNLKEKAPVQCAQQVAQQY